MRSLGLPKLLVRYLARGELHDRIAEAYAAWEKTAEVMDAFEAQYPEVAKALPWFEAREAWKKAGRPRPEWYEVLKVLECTQPIRTGHITQNLYGMNNKYAKPKRRRAAAK